MHPLSSYFLRLRAHSGLLPPQFFHSLVSFPLSQLGPGGMFPFLYVAPHLRRIHTDNIQYNTIKLHLQAYYPVCYPPHIHHFVHMLLFQYDSHTILFVFASTVPHFMSSAYAFCSLLFQRVSCTHSRSLVV